MRHRRVFLSVCLIGTACGADGVAQTLGRPPAPAARMHDMSYGTWTDLPDAWGYFPPSGIAERQSMLAWADRLRLEAALLERSLIRQNRAGRPGEIEAVRAVRAEAETLRQVLLFGSHMADLKPRLVALAETLEAVELRRSSDPRIANWLERGDREFEALATRSGPWPKTPLAARRPGFGAKTAEPAGKPAADAPENGRSTSRP